MTRASLKYENDNSQDFDAKNTYVRSSSCIEQKEPCHSIFSVKP